MTHADLITFLQQLPSSRVTSLMPKLGYAKQDDLGDDGMVFASTTSGEQVAVPTAKRFRDYGSTILALLESLATRQTTMDDLVALLVLPDCDIYRHKFDDDLTAWGSFPLDSFSEAVPALFDLLRFTAAGVYSQRRHYTKLPADAQQFEKACRVGQTEVGSFIVKIFCPTNPTGIQIDTRDEPFGRLVNRGCMENLSFLKEDGVEGYGVDLPATMNRNVAAAISRLRPMSFHPDAEAMMWYSAQYTGADELAAVEIDEKTFQRAAAVERRLTQEAGKEQLSLRGYIVELHKDRPQKQRTVSHKITMEVQHAASGWRKVQLSLLPADYRQAVYWHDTNQKVRIEAIFDKQAHPWRALEIIEFQNLDAQQGELFPEQPGQSGQVEPRSDEPPGE